MRWLERLWHLKESQTPVVLVTVLGVRGHAPRETGAKMLVTASEDFDTVGGGNLEAMAIESARGLLRSGTGQSKRLTVRLTPEDSLFGVQCCGGEVELLLEPMVWARPTVAIFGVGHVGLALARVLSSLPIELWLIDSREAMLHPERLQFGPGQARWRAVQTPVPDSSVTDLPAGAHVLVMTHDHSEDLYVLKAALSRRDLGFLGLIGSAVKWTRFQRKLLEAGFAHPELARITCPIGLPAIPGKSPEAIAIAVAAQVLAVLWPERIKPDQTKSHSATERGLE